MHFYIKQNSSLPELKFPLTKEIMEKYNITDELMQNAAVTFSMVDNNTGLYVISNVPAKLVINDDSEYFNLDETKYTLAYRFRLKDSKRVGFYSGKFTLDFLN